MYELDLYTEKCFLTNVSYDVMHEWEEDFSEALQIPAIEIYQKSTGALKRNIVQFIGRARRILKMDWSRFRVNNYSKWHLVFVPNALVYLNYTYLPNTIPIFLDFPDAMVNKIAYATKKLPIYFVIAYDIYDCLKNAGSQNVEFIPMGISDSYVKQFPPKKTIDVVQFGRRNEKLHEWMMAYCSRHPEVEYVYVINSNYEYFSTTRGNIGRFEERTDFCDLIDRTKIALVSSPGVEGKSRFGDIDFITARFYECAAHYCFMIGRYTKNKETDLIGLNDVCANVNSKEEFDKYMDEYLNADVTLNAIRYSEFLSNNVMSERAKTLKSVIDRYL